MEQEVNDLPGMGLIQGAEPVSPARREQGSMQKERKGLRDEKYFIRTEPDSLRRDDA